MIFCGRWGGGAGPCVLLAINTSATKALSGLPTLMNSPTMEV